MLYGGVVEEDEETGVNNNNNSVTSGGGSQAPLLAYLQELQKDLSSESRPWGNSLYRAASFICDRIQSANLDDSKHSNNSDTNVSFYCFLLRVFFAVLL